MTAAKKLNDNDLKAIEQELEANNVLQSQGALSTDEALRSAYEIKARMNDGYNATTDKTPERVRVWQKLDKYIFALNSENFEKDREAGLKFKAEDTLDIDARNAIAQVNIVVGQMKVSGTKPYDVSRQKYYTENMRASYERTQNKDRFKITDEQHAYAEIRALNDYGKYIDTKHPEMVKLNQKYFDKCLSNYMVMAQADQDPDVARAKGILKKISDNLNDGKYSKPEFAQAVMNLLESRIPRSN